MSKGFEIGWTVVGAFLLWSWMGEYFFHSSERASGGAAMLLKLVQWLFPSAIFVVLRTLSPIPRLRRFWLALGIGFAASLGMIALAMWMDL